MKLNLKTTGLVLEGGGMRGVFTSGVLDWLRSLGIPMSLSEVGIGEEHFEDMAQHCVEHEGVAYAWIPLTKKDIVDIFKSCL